MIFMLNTLYNKHEMIEIGIQNQRKIASIIASTRIILLSTVIHFICIAWNFFFLFLVPGSSTPTPGPFLTYF